MRSVQARRSIVNTGRTNINWLIANTGRTNINRLIANTITNAARAARCLACATSFLQVVTLWVVVVASETPGVRGIAVWMLAARVPVQSMPNGPADSPVRNWRTNGSSLVKASSASA